ncbi:MAG: hypothetical protein V3W41_12520 [Planctomycetota bacterium]
MNEDENKAIEQWRRRRRQRKADELIRFLVSQAEPSSIELLTTAFAKTAAPTTGELELSDLLRQFASATDRRDGLQLALDAAIASHPALGAAMNQARIDLENSGDEVEYKRTETERFLGPAGWRLREQRLRAAWEQHLSQHGAEKAAARLWAAAYEIESEAPEVEFESALANVIADDDMESGYALVQGLVEGAQDPQEMQDILEGPFAKLFDRWPTKCLERWEDQGLGAFESLIQPLNRGDIQERYWDRLVRLQR